MFFFKAANSLHYQRLGRNS